ncbi:MAG: GDSL-type esterase/lipase family protein [Myxococcota bacterium]
MGFAIVLVSGCSSSGGDSGTGGKTGAGGSVGNGGQASGGGSGSGSGGAQAGGASGGAMAGGRPGTGGSTGSGGATGGTSSNGGGTATGGTSNGGSSTTGGTSSGGTSTGGSTANGGSSSGGNSTGGSTASGGVGGSGNTHWVGTWTGSPYPVDANNQPPASLSNAVLRQVVHASLGGNRIRVQFSNLSGNGPVTINSAHVALCKATPAVDSTIDTATDKALAFSGMASVTIAQGKEVWSDPIDFTLPALGNVSITTAFGSVPSSLTGHAGARTTSYLQSGSTNVTAASMSSAQPTDHWYYISGMEVMADASAKAIVAIGDSITDGRGTDTNKNNRWTDVLAARLQANSATSNIAVMNQGIGATNLIGTTGTAAQARFARDVLNQSGVRYVIVLDGVNDINGGATYNSMKAAYDDLISRAHNKNLLIYGATILPFGASNYYSVDHENLRKQVNTYIKSGAFDGYIDFEVLGEGNPPKLQTAYATWAQTDGLHPGPAGYQKMGEVVDLMLFTK